MQIRTFIIDAFTDKPFTGNPAGVCLLEDELDEATMQSIANELKLSETAFIHKKEEHQHYSIRYFTPTVEIDFCGHASLAAAKLILDKFREKSVAFKTQKELTIVATLEDGYVKMIFPLYETVAYAANKELYEAFTLEEVLFAGYCTELGILLLEVRDKETLLQLKPDFQKALNSTNDIKEVVISSASEDKEYDFYSRCFCPWIGINEDPVTGASHSILAKYWGRKLKKTSLSAYQLSARGGYLHLTLIDDATLAVRSHAQIVFEGVLNR